MTHWTAQNTDAFIRRITFDFWTQLQKRMEQLPVTQLELANTFGVSESAISQVLNNSRNPTLATLVNYAHAVKLKLAIVPYADDDPDGRPVNSEIFTICWEKAGRPRTFGEAGALPSVRSASTSESLIVPLRKGYCLVQLQHAATFYGYAEQMLYSLRGVMDEEKEMQTAITQVPTLKAA